MVFYTTAACWMVQFLRLINRRIFYEKRFVSFDIIAVNDVWKFNSQEVPGIAFLSGGQTEIEATQNLNEINKINDTKFIMSFSYGRALQQSALKNWAKNIKDTTNTQKIFNHRSKMNGLSTSAKWSMDLENQITA